MKLQNELRTKREREREREREDEREGEFPYPILFLPSCVNIGKYFSF
jgi:hypothetical protein